MRSKSFLLMILLLAFYFELSAQAQKQGLGDNLHMAESDSAASLSDTQNENATANEIRQPFSWVSAGDVSKYEIIIERLNDDGSSKPVYFHATTEEETQACLVHIDPVLPPGHYRSEIKVFNILGLIEDDMTSIDEFVVRQAYRPEIKSVSYPLYMRSTVYLDDLDNDGIIKIEGRNLFEPAKTGKELTLTDYYLKDGRRKVRADEVLEHAENNKSITFRFDMRKLDVGNYHFFAQDASGLHSDENSDSEFTVKFKKWMDLDVSGGYTCPIVLHDDTFPTYLSRVLPMSAQAKVVFMPFKHSWGYLGIGLRGNYSRLYKQEDGYNIDGNLGMAHALLVYQLPTLRRRVIFEIHGGAGLAYFNNIIFHFPNDIKSTPLNTLSLSFDAGLSTQIYINKRIYSEIGLDYVFTMNNDMMLGTLLPSLGIGWQF